MKAGASAPGKVILFGEHFVVKGIPALAMAVNLRAEALVEEDQKGCYRVESSVEKGELCGDDPRPEPGAQAYAYLARRAGLKGASIALSSRIPPGAGLGSSAATSAAVAGASLFLVGRRGRELKEEARQLAMEGERVFHGKPSGVDVTVAVEGGLVAYRLPTDYRVLPPPRLEGGVLLLADTGVPRSTREAVMRVLERLERRKPVMETVYEAASVLTREAEKALTEGDLAAVGELMDIAQGLLSSIGVSFPQAEALIHEARRRGALGAKITGAGLGGSVIVLVEEDRAPVVEQALLAKGAVRVLRLSPEPRGLVVEGPL